MEVGPRNMPSVEKVKEFWAKKLSTKVYGHKADCPEEVMEEDFCWACGVSQNSFAVKLERCHIRPRKGYKTDPKWKKSEKDKIDAPSNLHMLCGYCHNDSEELTGLEYFRWFKKRKFNEGFNSYCSTISKLPLVQSAFAQFEKSILDKHGVTGTIKT